MGQKKWCNRQKNYNESKALCKAEVFPWSHSMEIVFIAIFFSLTNSPSHLSLTHELEQYEISFFSSSSKINIFQLGFVSGVEKIENLAILFCAPNSIAENGHSLEK